MTMTPDGVNLGPDRQLQLRMLITMLLLGVVYGVFIVVLWNYGQGLMLVAVGVLVLAQFWLSDRMVLAAMHAKVVTEEEQPKLHSMVGRLAVQAGIPKPRVAVASSKVPNAFATGRSQKHAAVAVTTGLLEVLGERELEAVLAHEVSHVRSRDVQVMTYVSFFAVVASTLMTIFFWSSMFGGHRRGHGAGGGSYLMIAYMVTIVVWIVSQILVASLSRYREFAADRGAAALTGRPMDLASALERISNSSSQIPKEDLRRVETMNAFLISPAVGDSLARLFSTHPSTTKRVARLRDLSQNL